MLSSSTNTFFQLSTLVSHLVPKFLDLQLIAIASRFSSVPSLVEMTISLTLGLIIVLDNMARGIRNRNNSDHGPLYKDVRFSS